MDEYERKKHEIVDPTSDAVIDQAKMEDASQAPPDISVSVDPVREAKKLLDKDMTYSEKTYSEQQANDTYTHAEVAKSKRGPTADEIKNYRLGDKKRQYSAQPEPNKYNQPRPGDLTRHTPNLKMGMSIAAFVLGILGFALFWIPYFGFVTPVLAVLFGAIGLAQSQSQPDDFGGKGFALAGIVVGLICLGLAFLSLSVLACVVDWFGVMFQAS